MRHVAEFLDRACFRIGLAAAMIAKVKGGCAVIITAGADSKEFNAAKIVELDGGPLDASWVNVVTLMLGSLEVEGTVKTFGELGFKGFPLGVNFFDYQPLADPLPVAETYEEMLTEKPEP